LNNAKENINQDKRNNDEKTINMSEFYGNTKIFDGKKTFTIVPEDEEISISSFNEKNDNAITPSKTFNSGYKYSMDILQDVRGRKYNTSN
jgi:hypothetical protein